MAPTNPVGEPKSGSGDHPFPVLPKFDANDEKVYGVEAKVDVGDDERPAIQPLRSVSKMKLRRSPESNHTESNTA